MKAILVKSPGGPEQLELGEYPTPRHGEGELLVRVHATALNRADILQREGKYPPPPGASPILGLEIAGTVEAVGSAAAGWNEGDRVFGLLPGGGYAEYALIHHKMALPMPPRMTFAEAAAIPEVFLTAFQTLYWFGSLEPGLHVLVHAGASGVGTAAIQRAKEAGAHAYVTASAGKLDFCREVGADVAIDYRSEDWADRVLDVTGGLGADIIVDFIGAPYFEQNLECLALDGRLVMLATLGGTRVPDFNLRSLFKKRAQVFATTLRSRSLDYQILLNEDFAAYALPMFLDRRLKPVIDRVYDWADAAEAHRRMEANLNTGKIVLTVLS
jgi:tumor protein p53-inducible protein 3